MALTVELSGGREPGLPADPFVGRLLLHYRVVEQIGQGGMSVVYRGRDEHLGRDVAIKVLHPFLAEKDECRVRLAREARAVARLEHPHIVQVYAYSGEPPTLDEKPGKAAEEARRSREEGFIVAELVRGPTLKRFAEKHALWRNPELGALVVWQLLLALQHAHDNGIVHRDLKPENVMVRDDGVLKLMDFGIAQVADQGGLTVTGTLLGSPAHMAPECIDGHPADERSDLFSMGTVLYWITTGALPFEAPTPHALLKQIVDGKMVPAQQRAPRISDDLARVIGKSVATRATDRYGSAREFADALREVLERSGLTVSSAALTDALASPARFVPAFGAQVRAAFLARATRLLDEGSTARALGCLNRVLADDAADADARALLERVHSGDGDGDGDDAVEDVDADAGAVPPTTTPVTAPTAASSSAPPATATTTTATTARTTTATTTTSPDAPGGRWRWQTTALLAGAAALLVGVIAIARLVDGATDRARADAGEGSAGVGVNGDDGDPAAVDSSTEDPAALDASLPTPPKRPGKHQRDPRRLASPVREPRASTGAGTASATKGRPTPNAGSAATAPSVRKVTFRINAWADISIDGGVVARNRQLFDTELAVGPHVVLFRNPRARDVQLNIDVAPQGPDPVFTVRLEPRPALLSVRSNVADAFVDVQGTGGKLAQETSTRPIIVPLVGSREEREVFIYKKGWLAYRRRHAFVAGETLALDVVLEPDSGDSSSTSQ